MRHDLVGFIVGALDAPEHEVVRKELEIDAQLREQLSLVERGLEPLGWDNQSVSAPAGLSSRTCDLIKRIDVAESGSKARLQPASLAESSSDQRRWTMADFVVAAGVCLAASCLFFPAIVNGRYHQQRNVCQKKMKQVGEGLTIYSQNVGHGMFPQIPTEGKLAVAGVYAPTLVENGLVNDSNVFYCPAKSNTVVLRIPRRKDVLSAEGSRLVSFHNTMGGDYAYTLGFVRDGRLHGIRNRSRSHFPVLADEPQEELTNSIISSHGRGQNVLFEDGHVRFVSTRNRPGFSDDDMFRNHRGLQEAGVEADDAVLAPSFVAPTPVSAVK